MTTGYYKNIFSISVVVLTFLTIIASHPAPEQSKIRIHVPVKHHTHFHTKTIIKEVHVPLKHHVVEEIHKPIKYHHHSLADDDHKPLKYHHHSLADDDHKPIKYHHHSLGDDFDDDEEDDLWSHKPYIKRKKFHPFLKR